MKQGEENPCVSVDLRKRASLSGVCVCVCVCLFVSLFFAHVHYRYAPPFCPDFAPVHTNGEQGDGSRKEFARRVEPTVWLIAWDSYALGAVPLGQVEYVLCE